MRTIETNCLTGPVKKKKPNFYVLFATLLLMFFSGELLAQTISFPTSCTSKDLTLLKARLPAPATSRCECSCDRILVLGIHNGTSSTRTAFALWGTLIRRNASGVPIYANGDVIPTGQPIGVPIFACAGPISPSGDYFLNAGTLVINNVNILPGTSGYPTIHIDCGQSLDIVDMHLAWTVATPGATCTTLFNSPSTINPKCGTQDIIHVDIGVSGTATPHDASCSGNDGSIDITPSGGKPKYNIYLYRKLTSGAGDSTYIGRFLSVDSNSTKTFISLTVGYYTAKISDNAGGAPDTCFVNKFTQVINPVVVTAPVLSKVDNCDGTTSITAKDGSGSTISASELTWSNGATTNPISVTTTTAVTATRTIGVCTSPNSTAITPAPKTTPAAPVLSKVDNCDAPTSITAKDGSGSTISASELTWSNGATTNPISVTTTTAMTATRTVNGCTSASSTAITPAPRTTPVAPVLSKVDNCDGTTSITAKDGSGNIITASQLTWSNGATTNPISVSTTTSVTATRTVNLCTSGNSNTITPAPGTTPSKPIVSITEPSLCGSATATLTVTNPVVNATYTVTQSTGGFNPTPVKYASGTLSFTGLKAGFGFSIIATMDGSCPSGTTDCDHLSSVTERSIDAVPTVQNEAITVKAYPNPFNDRVKFVINSPAAGNGSLEVYNVMGQRVKTVYQGRINAGNQSYELVIPKKQQETLIYILRVDGKKVTGKLLQLNN
jgi:hypothetical protein